MNPRQNHVAVNASSLVAFHATARLADAYTGAPAAATEAEGHEMLARLATMIVTEVREGLASTGEG